MLKYKIMENEKNNNQLQIELKEEGIGFQTHGVVEQAEVQVTLSFYTELSGIFSKHGYLT